MNTIKVYLGDSGRIRDVHKDFPLYKGQFNDKLLNVLVPTSILAPQFELQHYIGQMSGVTAPTDQTLNDFVEANTYPTRSAMQGDIIEFYNSDTQSFFIYTYDNEAWVSTEVDSFGTLNTLAGTSVKIGMVATKSNGTTYESKSYFMRYLKTLTYQNVEYALYERKLPKEFTSFVGQGQNAPTLVINVVNVDTENNAVTSIITSQSCSLDVMASNMLDQDESIEASDLESLTAQVNSLSAEVDLKQNKRDETLNTTSKMVAGAINELDLQVDANTSQVATNTGDISSLDTRVTALEQQDATEERYIGKMTGTTLPTDAQLDAFVLSTAGRETQGGDVVMFVLEVTGGTDKNYKYRYSSITNSWSGYEIPATEPASNTDMGIVQGSYGSTKNTQVDIVGGNIKNIYVKDNSNNLRDIAEYTNATNASVTNILNGTTAVGKATRADQDGNGNNIVQTYLTQTAGATKQQLYDYALPRAFNDVSYLNSTGYQATIPTDTYPIFSVQTSAVGYTQLFSAEKPIENAQFELTNKNSYETDIFVTASIDCSVTFRLTTELYKNGSWQELNIEVTTLKNLVADQVEKLVFANQFNSIQGVINVESGDILRQTLEVQTTTSTATTFNVYSNTTYPSDFILNTTSQIIYIAEGRLGQVPTFALAGTYDSSTQTLVYEIPSSFEITDGVQGLFELSYTEPLGLATKVKITQGVQEILLKTPYTYRQSTLTTLENLKFVRTGGSSAQRKLIFTGVFRIVNGDIYILADVEDLHTLNDKMDKANPKGTGSISMNPNPNYSAGLNAVILGNNGVASREDGVSIGYANRVTSLKGVSIGSNNTTNGYAATSLGVETEASGQYSQSQGLKTKAKTQSQFVFGEFNALDNSGSATTRGDYVEIVGNGTAENARSNARTLDWSGNEVLAGTLQATGLTDGTTTKTMTEILAGGGNTKYLHTIYVIFSFAANNYLYTRVNIINNSSEAFTTSSFQSWLSENTDNGHKFSQYINSNDLLWESGANRFRLLGNIRQVNSNFIFDVDNLVITTDGTNVNLSRVASPFTIPITQTDLVRNISDFVTEL